MSFEGPFGIPLESLPVNRAVSSLQLGNSVLLSSGDRDLRLFMKVQQGSQSSPGVEEWTLSSSRVVKGVSGFRSRSVREFGHFQDHRQERQTSHLVLRGYSVFYWSQFRGIRTYLAGKVNSASFLLTAVSAGFHSRFNW